MDHPAYVNIYLDDDIQFTAKITNFIPSADWGVIKGNVTVFVTPQSGTRTTVWTEQHKTLK